MPAKASNRDWDCWGNENPYFGVLADPKFLTTNLNADSIEEFFDTGKRHVEHVYAVIRSTLQADFQPRRVLDFGCGVGRLLIAFNQVAETVISVDVSSGMLAQARQQCESYGAQTVKLLHGDQLGSLTPHSFDLVHSFIVFQHIPVAHGELLFRKLINLVAEGGVGAIHFTYSDSRSRYVAPF